MLRLLIKKTALAVILLAAAASIASARGPLNIDGDPAVTIYRDFDDGLFGRSRYRGVLFSVKLEAFDRYRSLDVGETDGLTAYLVSPARAAAMAAGNGSGITRLDPNSPQNRDLSDDDPVKWRFRFSRGGMEIVFSLERAPEDLYAEIKRTYPDNPAVAAEVSESYKNGYIVRILTAENVYRPQFARIDYEDILISAALVGDDFQPLWGIHDGNAFP